MTRSYSLFLFFSLLSIMSFAQNKVPVTILGTYHFSNPGLDAANIQSDDVKTDKRQAELAALANALAEFKPTKIAIEVPYGNEVIPDRYETFLQEGNIDSLKHNEIYQIGFRLGALLQHPELYPIDHRLNIDAESMPILLEEAPEKMEIINARIAQIQDSLNKWTEEILYKGTITDFLRFMNLEESINKNHDIYLDFAKDIYSENSYAGAEMLANWYERNLLIFQNLTRITDFDNPNERILIIYGQGHSKILKELTDSSDFYEFIDILEYLD